MATERTETNGRHETQDIKRGETVDLKYFTFYVYLIDGTVQAVAPATRLHLTNNEILFLLGSLVVERLPRKTVYLAAQEPTCPAVMV